MRRMVHWRGLDAWRAETVEATFHSEGIEARGVQLGIDPTPYRLDYELDALAGFVTRSLAVVARGEGWSRRLTLAREDDGTWGVEAASDGNAPFAEPGGPTESLDGALDCDLGFSPLTNLMPVRRSGLHRRSGAEDFLMAWVSVPDLEVFPDAQRYEHVRLADGGSVVRFIDRGRFAGFTAELRLDRDGLAIGYPGLAERVAPPPEPTQ